MKEYKGDLILEGHFISDESIKVEGSIKGKHGNRHVIIVNGSIDALDINAANIDAADIDASDINARNIDAANIDAANINASNINAANINAANIDALDINARNIDAANIDASDINARNIDAADINASNINARNIDAADIDARNIVCYKRFKKNADVKTIARTLLIVDLEVECKEQMQEVKKEAA